MKSTCSGRLVGLASAMTMVVVSLCGAGPASAGLEHEFAAFSDCPINAVKTNGVCVRSVVTGGEFVLGSKTVTINKTIILQGAVEEGTTVLIPAADGNTLAKVPLTVPGGLVGLGVPGEEVTATAELAGTVLLNSTNLNSGKGVAATIPLKVKLDNIALGASCYVGSASEPIKLIMTTGTTSPPPPNKPITGSPGTLSFESDGNFLDIAGVSLVDNAFAAPGANGCGAVPLVIDPVVNSSAGLPAAAGTNTAIMTGSVEAVEVSRVRAQAKLPAIGRCIKAEPKETGRFENSKCTLNVDGGGRYEWIEGPGSKRQFSATAGTTTLRGIAGGQVKCSGAAATGEYTGAKALTASLKLSGCEMVSTKEPCQTGGAASGEIDSSPLAGTLGFIEDQATETAIHASVGVDLSHEPSLIQAECGGISEGVVVTGSVIGKLVKIDTMSTSNTVKFTASNGKQNPEEFEEGPKDTLSATLGSGGEQAGLSTTQKISNEEPLEIKAIQSR